MHTHTYRAYKMTSVQQYSIDSNLPSMNLDTVIPPNVLNRRRHAISSTGLGIESLYSSEPRMKRRNAISYENDDSAAKYIRFLGEFYLCVTFKVRSAA